MKIFIVLSLCLLVSLTAGAMNPVCLLCHDIVRMLQKSVRPGPFVFAIDKIATLYCTKKHLDPSNVCKGAITEMTKVIIPAFWQHHTDPHMICPSLKLCAKEYKKRSLEEDVAKIL